LKIITKNAYPAHSVCAKILSRNDVITHNLEYSPLAIPVY